MPTEPSKRPIANNTIAKLMIWRDEKGDKQDFLGTCFAFPSTRYFLTAAHCVDGLKPSTLRVQAAFEGVLQAARVDWIANHPQADLALLGVTTSPWASATPFVGVYTNPLLGQPFYAFGYPLEIFSDQPDRETERLFRGHLQRLFYYRSPHSGYAYSALELSIPCPRGLSGGPVFVTEGDFGVIGVVAENLESINYRHSEKTTTEDGVIERTIYQAVINYGVAVEIGPHMDWIEETIRIHG